jgi:hypothetical protein
MDVARSDIAKQKFPEPPSVCPALRIFGQSGCRLELVPGAGGLSAVRKSCANYYARRLRKQRLKQQSCSQDRREIIIPKVLDHDSLSFTMERLPMLDCISFFENAAPAAIRERMEILFCFVEQEFLRSETTLVTADVFQHKIETIEKNVSADIWLRYYAQAAGELSALLDGMDDLLVPLGGCHGDLTLSNVMFSLEQNTIGLIDFLDSFIESPLVDLVKLRQDTRFSWTSAHCGYPHDSAKILLVNRWLDEIINSRFRIFIATPPYRVLEIINYLRLAPYMQSDSGHSHVAQALSALVTS